MHGDDVTELGSEQASASLREKRARQPWHEKGRDVGVLITNNYEFGSPVEYRKIRAITSFKVTDFGTNRKLIYDFLLLINTNLPPIYLAPFPRYSLR